MPFICCVPNCKRNYRNGPKVTVFKFPDDQDMKEKWVHAIKRKNLYPSNTSKVSGWNWYSWKGSLGLVCCKNIQLFKEEWGVVVKSIVLFNYWFHDAYIIQNTRYDFDVFYSFNIIYEIVKMPDCLFEFCFCSIFRFARCISILTKYYEQ